MRERLNSGSRSRTNWSRRLPASRLSAVSRTCVPGTCILRRMALPLESKTALVTGASKGVGKGIALELARCGCDVALNYHSDREGAEDTAAEITSMGRVAFPVQADVAQAAEVDRMFAEVADRFPELDILVNNAGTQVWKALLDLEEVEW